MAKGLEGRTYAIPHDANLAVALTRIMAKRTGSLVVTGKDGTVCGLITERDILLQVARYEGAKAAASSSSSAAAYGSSSNNNNSTIPRWQELRVEQAMTPNSKVICTFADDPVKLGLSIMARYTFRNMPVIATRASQLQQLQAEGSSSSSDSSSSSSSSSEQQQHPYVLGVLSIHDLIEGALVNSQYFAKDLKAQLVKVSRERKG
jgi:CBS domain-containing protein